MLYDEACKNIWIQILAQQGVNPQNVQELWDAQKGDEALKSILAKKDRLLRTALNAWDNGDMNTAYEAVYEALQLY